MISLKYKLLLNSYNIIFSIKIKKYYKFITNSNDFDILSLLLESKRNQARQINNDIRQINNQIKEKRNNCIAHTDRR